MATRCALPRTSRRRTSHCDSASVITKCFRNSMCASSRYLKIITPSPRTHFLFSQLSKRNLMSTGSKIASVISKNTYAAPNRHMNCCLPWNKLQLMMYQNTLVGCYHCFHPTKRQKNLLQPLEPRVVTNTKEKHHVQLHTTRTTICDSHRNYKNSLHREGQKKRKMRKLNGTEKMQTLNTGEETVERQEKKKKETREECTRDRDKYTNCRKRLSRCDEQTQQQTTSHHRTQQNSISEHGEVC